MFVVQNNSDENLINFIYDSRCPWVAFPKGRKIQFSELFCSPKGNGAYIKLF